MTSNLAEDEARMAQSLAQDRPTIDSAVKSFISLVCARSMTASALDDATTQQQNQQNQQKQQLASTIGLIPLTDSLAASSISEDAETSDAIVPAASSQDGIPASALHVPPSTDGASSVQKDALALARAILKETNAFAFGVHDTVAMELAEKPGTSDEMRERLLRRQVTAQLWNGLIESKKKPSKFFGRLAFREAWRSIKIVKKFEATRTDEGDDAVFERKLGWLKEFERLLMQDDRSCDDDANNNDAALLWAADGGKAELARRRHRRQSGASARSGEPEATSPTELATVEE